MEPHGNRDTRFSDHYQESQRRIVMKSSIDQANRYNEKFMDSTKPVKSRADIILTEIEKQLEVTESEYVSAMERLQYSRMLYDTAGSTSLEANDCDRNDESEIIEKTSKCDFSSRSRSRNDNNCENNLASGDSGFPKEIKNARRNEQDKTSTNDQSSIYNSRSFPVTSRTNIYNDTRDRNSNDSDTQIYFTEQSGDGRKHLFYENSTDNSRSDNREYLRSERTKDDNSNRKQHPYQIHLAEYSKGLQDELAEEFRNCEKLRLKEEETYSEVKKSSRQKDSKKRKLHLNLLERAESLATPLENNNKKSRNDKQRKINSKVALKSIDDTVGVTLKRKRKKRGGIKISASRCTTATRDTSISDNKKDIRRKKQRAHSTISGLQSSQNRRRDVAPKNNKKNNNNNTNISEVVEIYHNAAIKSGSLSVVSSKHSKLMESRGVNTTNKIDQPSRVQEPRKLQEKEDKIKRIYKEIEEQKFGKEKNDEIEESLENDENFEDEIDEENDLPETIELRSDERKMMDYDKECSVDKCENELIQDYKNRYHRSKNFHSTNDSFPCCDNLSPRNYELPTVASKLKQVHRSYFNRFNFRNIPFVVGTSITPSYNLGLNIQEVLSLMKTRQIMHAEVSPILINNVSKSTRPVSTLLGCIKDEDEEIPKKCNFPCDENLAENIDGNACNGNSLGEKMSRSVQNGPFPVKTPKLSCIYDAQKLYDNGRSCNSTRIESISKKQKTQSICSSMRFNQPKSILLQPELTQSFLLKQRQEELNSGDSQSMKWPNAIQSSKGIREVMINFHDQYEAMITKFEKLEEEVKKSGDKELEKELASLEKELNAKEEEIKAVASLYQEVMLLKQQMRLLHEKNSLVCVATELAGSPRYLRSSMRSSTANPMRLMNPYRRSGSLNNHNYNNHQGPSTSTIMAGVLRQIKTFQKQLKSTS